MAKWKKHTLKLKDSHRWKAKDGYRIFVANRGAVRFDFPQAWLLKPDADSFKFHDAEPPDDNCRLELSVNYLPPADWSRLPLAQFLREMADNDERDITTRGEIVTEERTDLRLAWTEFRFVDPIEKREAYSRILLGIGGRVQCLITFDYWAEDAAQLTPVWDEVVKSLQLGKIIPDPTTGQMPDPRLN